MKNKFNRKALIIVISVCLVVLISIIFIFVFKNNKHIDTNSNYNVNNKVEELPGTKTYDDENILSEHCVDKVCVLDATLYYSDTYNSGRVEYTVINKNKKSVSGKLQMVFNETTIDIVYNDLGSNESLKTSTQFTNKKISNVEDYKLKKIK